MSVWDALRESASVESVARRIGSGHSPHAWLLIGPRGSGKRRTALAIAAALDCDVEPGVGCGECSACRRIMRSRHPDVHHVIPEGPIISVDVVREYVIPEAARSPFEGRHTVFVIEEADRMNDPAQNALLKTLEEPQPDTVFVLLTDQEDELLETIRSRCHFARLEPIPEERVVELLIDAGASEDDARLAARVSDGEAERARSLLFDEVAAQRRRTWLSIPARLGSSLEAIDGAAEIVQEARAAVKERERAQKQEVVEFAEAIGEARGTAAARNALAKRHRRELRRLEEELLGEALETIGRFYRDVLAARSGRMQAVVNADVANELEAWTGSDPSEAELVAAMQRCVETRSALVRNANPPLAIEGLLLELVALVPPPARAVAS
ncbi:MAG: DNA polymerase III subunit delta' [Actinomycetota bacterium]